LLAVFDRQTLRGSRYYAIVSVLLGCGLRRAELAALGVQDLQQREEHWVFADLVGKGGHVRTVPVPFWIEAALRIWMAEAKISDGPIFRAINKAGRIAGHSFSPKVIWGVVKQACSACNLGKVAPHDLRRYAESRTMPNALGRGALSGQATVIDSA
jgi:integrase